MMEGLGYGARDQELLFSLLWTATFPIIYFGAEEQQKKYLTGLAPQTREDEIAHVAHDRGRF
jgi:hypothetical protein